MWPGAGSTGTDPGQKDRTYLEIRQQRGVIPMNKTVLIEYCDLKAEIKEIRRMIQVTEDRLRKIE